MGSQCGRRDGQRAGCGGVAWGLTAVAVLVVGVGLTYSLWWTKPSAFTPVGGGFFYDPTQSLRPATAAMVNEIAEQPEVVTVTRASPRVVVNTADARITFARCEGDPAFFTVRGPASRVCESLGEVEGQQLTLGLKATETITMTIEPRQPGRVVVRGMRTDYTRGAGHLWQRGSQATGPVIKMRITR